MGVVVLGAGIVIALLDSDDQYHTFAKASLSEQRDARSTLAMPASAYAETLVGPSKRGLDAVRVVDDLLDSLPASIQPIDRSIARRAADLRAQHPGRLRLPDALVVATALELEAELILTTDRRWPKLPVTVRSR